MRISPPETLDDVALLMVSVARYGRGLYAWRPSPRPPRPVELFDMEGCPYCRRVRECLSELDLDYVARTSGRGARTRAQALALGGRTQFPLLVDPNVGVTLYESEAILDHLWSTYGGGRPRLDRALRHLDTAGSIAASALRVRRGARVRAGHGARVQPPELPVLYNFEASPWCRKVREVLDELDLHTHVKNVAKASPHRPELVALGGKMQVPYLSDPNQGVAMYESADIIRYLEATYG